MLFHRSKKVLTLFGASFHFHTPSDLGFLQQLIFECLYLKRYIPDQGIILDVGGNIGQFYFFLKHVLKLAHSIISFEPLPQVFTLLQKNNSNSYNVAITAQKELILSYGQSTLVASEYPEEGSTEQERVDGATLQSYDVIADADMIAFLKIDTEWSELSILKTISDDIFAKTRCMLIECSGKHRSSSGSLEEVIAYVATKGFHVARFGSAVYAQDEVSIIDVLFTKG